MAELSLRERLQPTLLDRLVDDERMLTVFDLTVEPGELARLGLPKRDLADLLAGQGLAPFEERGAGGPAAPTAPAAPLRMRFCAPYGRVSVPQLKALVLKTPGAPQGVSLQSFCAVEVRNELNDTPESSDQRYVSSRRLREYVCRDLAMLLNSTSLEASYDLSELPHVQRSVLNFGMPPLAGRAPKSVDLQQIAHTIEGVIRQFEPRLSDVRVTPETQRNDDDHQLHLRIEAMLWSQPAPQHLVLRTRISTESGDVDVSESH
jgi:type VI secretion system protein ImpF